MQDGINRPAAVHALELKAKPFTKCFTAQQRKQGCAFQLVDCRQRLRSKLQAEPRDPKKDDFVQFLLDTQQNVMKVQIGEFAAPLSSARRLTDAA